MRTSLSEILKVRQCLRPNPFPFPNQYVVFALQKTVSANQELSCRPVCPTLLGALRAEWSWEGAGRGSWSGTDPGLAGQRSGWAQALLRNVSKPREVQTKEDLLLPDEGKAGPATPRWEGAGWRPEAEHAS